MKGNLSGYRPTGLADAVINEVPVQKDEGTQRMQRIRLRQLTQNTVNFLK